MNVVAKFEKVSFEQFKEDFKKCFPSIDNIEEVYKNITIPKRATKGSAGYDFVSPINIELNKGESILVPTGIRCKIKEGWVMFALQRSSIGIKKDIVLKNTMCVGDSDYYNANNEGHYFMSIKNTGNNKININMGERFVQAVFTQFGITEDDDVEKERIGGFGSTGV